MLGITPEEVNPGHYTQIIHPDDEERLGQARARVYKMEKEIFQARRAAHLPHITSGIGHLLVFILMYSFRTICFSVRSHTRRYF